MLPQCLISRVKVEVLDEESRVRFRVCFRLLLVRFRLIARLFCVIRGTLSLRGLVAGRSRSRPENIDGRPLQVERHVTEFGVSQLAEGRLGFGRLEEFYNGRNAPMRQ